MGVFFFLLYFLDWMRMYDLMRFGLFCFVIHSLYFFFVLSEYRDSLGCR